MKLPQRMYAFTCSVVSVLAVLCACAETFSFNGTPGDAWYDWTAASTWTGGSTHAYPQAGDSISRPGVGQNKDAQFRWDLGGDQTISGFAFGNDWWITDAYRFRNGSLTVSGRDSVFPVGVTIALDDSADLIFPDGSKLNVGDNYSQSSENVQLVVSEGCSFKVDGDFYPRRLDIRVAAGGTFTYGRKATLQNCNANKLWNIYNSGTVNFDNGLQKFSSTWSAPWHIEQIAGELVLGGIMKTSNNLYYQIELKGGKVVATNDVSFSYKAEQGSPYLKFVDNADVELSVVAGKTFDLSNFTYDGAATVKTSGAGTIKLADAPSGLRIDGGTLVLAANTRTSFTVLSIGAGASFTIANANTTVSSLEDMEGSLVIGAPGLTVTDASGAALTGTFSIVASAFNTGDTILSTADAALRTKVKGDLKDAGIAVTEDGDALKVGASEYVFNSTTTTNLNDPAGWACGYVPSNVPVTISGAGVVGATTDLPTFASIKVSDGATLRVGGTATLPQTTVSGASTLEIAGAVSADALTFTVEGDNVPRLTIDKDATLGVPGGSAFGDVDMCVNGTLAAAGEGSLTLGYAASGKTAVFGLAMDGGVVRTTAGDILLFSPANGGGVSALRKVTVANGAQLARDVNHGLSFGYQNPASEEIEIEVDSSTICLGYYGTRYVAGGVKLSLVNGAQFIKGTEMSDSTARQKGPTQLELNDSAEIEVDGGCFNYSVGAEYDTWNHGRAYLNVAPSAEDATPLALRNCWFDAHHVEGNGKAVLEVENATNRIVYCTWNRGPFLKGFKSVRLTGDYTFMWPSDIKCSDNNYDAETVDIPFGGVGGLTVVNDTNRTKTYTISSADNTATGTLRAAGTGALALVLTKGARWNGPVELTDKVSLSQSAVDEAAEISVGGLVLRRDLNFRVWSLEKFDKVNIGAFGLVTNDCRFTITARDGFEPTVGDEFVLGTIPPDTVLPANDNQKWLFEVRADQQSPTGAYLVLKAASADFRFTGGTGESKVVDLNDPNGWACGYVPDGQDVVVDGARAVVGEAIPTFASITLKNGAGLSVVAQDEVVELPRVELRDVSSFALAAGAEATLTVAPTFILGDLGEMSTVTVPAGATLNVPGGTAFKNCSLSLGGMLATTGDGHLVFGTANANETAPFEMVSEGATIVTRNSAHLLNASRIDFAVPAAGGAVAVARPIVLKDTVISNDYDEVANFKDGFAFGLNNPTDRPVMIVADNTQLDAGADTYVAGAANLVLTNGSVLTKKRHKEGDEPGYYYSLYVQNRGKITLADGGEIRSGVTRVNNDLTTAVVELNPDEAGYAGIEVLGGGVGCWYKLNGMEKGVVRFAGGAMDVFKSYWWGVGNRNHLFYNLESVEIADGTRMLLRGVKDKLDTNYPNLTYFELEAPFAGGGDLVVTNTWEGQTMEPRLVRSDNTCTGRLEVADCETGCGARLTIVDGANWAGTLVLNENVSIVNLTDGSKATANVFGRLSGTVGSPLRLRVWKKDGEITANDSISLTQTGSTGVIVFEEQNGEELKRGDRFVLGTAPVGAWSKVVFRNADGHRLAVKESAPDAQGLVTVTVVPSTGFALIIR